MHHPMQKSKPDPDSQGILTWDWAAVYSPAMTDFILMVKNTSFMHITGPDVIKAVTREEVTSEDLGGAMVHNAKSGVAHFAAEDEEDCFYQTRKLLSYLPQNNMEDPPFVPTDDPGDRTDYELDGMVPDNPNKPYDVKDVIRRVVDDGDFFEVQAHWARNIIVGFARMGGASSVAVLMGRCGYGMRRLGGS